MSEPGRARLASVGAGGEACPLGACDGSGWILGPEDMARPCECREARIARRRARGVSSVIPPRYRGVGFDRPPVSDLARAPASAPVVEEVRAFVGALDERLSEGRGLWLVGDVGTGKTSLAMLASKAALEAGRTVAIYSLPKLLYRIRRTYEGSPGDDSYLTLFNRLTTVDLLHIDDLVGAEKRSEWVLEQLYAIVNERYEGKRAMLVTVNVEAHEKQGNDPLGECMTRLNRQIGERVVSRLVEICGDPLPLFGQDLRYRVA